MLVAAVGAGTSAAHYDGSGAAWLSMKRFVAREIFHQAGAPKNAVPLALLASCQTAGRPSPTFLGRPNVCKCLSSSRSRRLGDVELVVAQHCVGDVGSASG